MPHANAPLPALHHTAPTKRHNTRTTKKSPFSLDNYRAATQPPVPPLPRSASSVAYAQSDSFVHGSDGDQRPLSPAESLVAAAAVAALAPLSSSSSSPPSPPPPSVSGVSAGAWRSQLLECETRLRELTTKGVHEPPSLGGVHEVVDLFDQVCRNVQVHQGNAFLGGLLRLFRVEFCRAIFLSDSVPGEGEERVPPRGAGAVLSGSRAGQRDRAGMSGCTSTASAAPAGRDCGLPQTYFEETASLQRTKAALTGALAASASGETLLSMERQLADKSDQLSWYQGELERVRRQYEQVAEECLKLRQTHEEHQREAAATQKRLRQDVQNLHVENKDLQIQLFRLRKQIAGGMSKILRDNYRHLKVSKMGLTQRLFNEGDERIALLVLLGQVESRVNEILDAYDNDFVLTAENSHRELQLKMAEDVTVLLEDMHYCESSYRRLVGARNLEAEESAASKAKGSGEAWRYPNGGNGGTAGVATGAPLQRVPKALVHSGRDEEAPDESDGYVAILFDPKIYEHFQARHAVQDRLRQYVKEREAGVKGGGAAWKVADESSLPSAETTTAATTPPPVAAIQTRRETLTTLLSGVLAEDTQAVRAKAATDVAAADDAATSQHQAAAPAMGQPVDALKRWSLDSRVVSGRGSQGAVAATRASMAATGGGAVPPPPTAPPSAASRVSFALADGTAGPRDEAFRDSPFAGETAPPGEAAAAAAAAETSTSVLEEESLEDVVARQKARWVAQILGPASAAVAFTVPGRRVDKGDVVVVHEKSAEVVPAAMMMRRVLHHPMEDLCTNRFLSTVEIFAGDNPSHQRLLCRVNHIDPALPIQVPESTNFVKVKYALTDKAGAGPVDNGDAVLSPAAAEAEAGKAAAAPPVFRGNPQLRLFKELSSKALVDGNLGLQHCAGAVNSTTASTVAFQRLQPMSPNRPPEWLLYQHLFGSYRSLTPRMMEVTTIDHVMSCAAERYFTRMEYRYDECYLRAAEQCATIQLRREMTERLFRDLHTLSDFQEALVDELESRYGFPELVAKVLYEMLCYLNAVCEKDTVLGSYLDVIRGFAPVTEVHFMSYMLYHLSYCWPESNPSSTVAVGDVRTVLEYVYRNASTIMPVRTDAILQDYDMSTRSAPLNFVNFRQFVASTMAHQEESVLLHLHGLFHAHSQRTLIDEAGWETYEAVIGKTWHQRDERRSLVRYLTSCLGVNKSASPTLSQLTLLAASAWSSNLWE